MNDLERRQSRLPTAKPQPRAVCDMRQPPRGTGEPLPPRRLVSPSEAALPMKKPPTHHAQAENQIGNFKICMTFIACAMKRLSVDGVIRLYDARHHRLYGNVLDFIGVTGGIARRYAGTLLTLDSRTRRFERADEKRPVVDIGNYEAEGHTERKSLTRKELQGGGVLVPGTVLFGLAFAGRLVEELYRVNIRKDNDLHTAYSREVNPLRQVSAIDPADSLNSGKYLCRCLHCLY